MEDLGIPSIKLSLPGHGIRRSLGHLLSEFSNIAPDPSFDRLVEMCKNLMKMSVVLINVFLIF